MIKRCVSGRGRAMFYGVCFVLATTTNNFAAVFVDFTGGGLQPLTITLPALVWEINHATDFNDHPVFGLGIAVGQSPEFSVSGLSMAGDSSNWSADNAALNFPSSVGNAFYENNDYAGLNSGGIIWFGVESSRNAVNGDRVIFSGGNISSQDNVAPTFVDGMYEAYLISAQTGQVVSTAATIVPEPSTTALLGLGALVYFVRRRAV